MKQENNKETKNLNETNEANSSCKKLDAIMQDLEDDFYLTQVLGVPLK